MRAPATLAALFGLAACGNSAPRPAEDHRVGSAGSAGSATPLAADVSRTGYRADGSDFARGDVQVRVEWPDVPTPARASPGRTRCGTAAAASVAPTTTWAIPDAIVQLDVDHGKPLPERAARVVVADCALAPRVVVAGASVTIASEVEQPIALALARAGDVAALGAAGPGSATGPIAPTGPIAIDVPIAGHDVIAPLVAGSLDLLGGSDIEPAWLVAATQPYVAVTEASGQVVLRDVPVGSFTVEALVPARAGQPARSGRATLSVTANALAEVTVQLR